MAKSKNLKKTVILERADIEAAFLNATSTTPDSRGRTSIVLYWKPAPGVVGYNLYRSDKKAPINGKQPIHQADSCALLKALVPEGSKAWKMLANAFASVQSRHSIKLLSDPLHRARLKDTAGFLAERTLLVGTNFEKVKPAQIPALSDPCVVIQRGLTDGEQALFDQLAGANLQVRQARGWAYIDSNVTKGVTYTYELRGVLENHREIVLDSGVEIKAGFFRLPNPPSGFSVTPGDSQILALWNRNNYAFSYLVQRADNPGGPFDLVNESPIIYDITKDLNNVDLAQPRPGFVDFQRWDEEGLPVSHPVAGLDIDGPTNGITYYYKVASCDILDRHGSWSSSQHTAPINSTPPMAPTDFRVDVSTVPFGLRLSWRKVTRDIRNHQILEVSQTYKVYRSDLLDTLDDLTQLPACQITTVTANPTDPTTITLTWLDTDPALRVPYGEKDFWYRLCCVDQYGNESAPSAAIAGRLPDITAPGPTKVTGADGFDDHISVYWQPNTEPDLAGYQIYRAICDHGKVFRPGDNEDEKKRMPCDFMLVGEVRVKEAGERLAATGQIYFEDYSVPAGSPLCYAFWVRAFDQAGNLYDGDRGCPREPVESSGPAEYVCQRLYEEIPPPYPIVTALKARDNAVQVEWISSPVQDLRAFHIYRSDRESDPPVFLGCILSDGTPYPGPWKGMKPDCGDIPGEANPLAAHGSYLDTTAEANHIYWYRVSALDWLGNESESADLTKIPAISTFTYDKDLPSVPAVLPLGAQPAVGCGLQVAWAPAYDPLTQKGILVFRSRSSVGNYRQVSPLVQADRFDDTSALRGTDYWYRVQAMALDGTLSEPSAPVRYRY